MIKEIPEVIATTMTVPSCSNSFPAQYMPVDLQADVAPHLLSRENFVRVDNKRRGAD